MDTRTLFGLVFFCYVTYVVAFKTCQQTGQILQVDVDGKVDKEGSSTPVTFKKGTNATLAVTFKPSKNSKSATSHCYGDIEGELVPFPVEKDGCKEMSPHCPLKAGSTYVFKAVIEVKKIYPSITLVVEWKETDDSGDSMFCIELAAKIM